MADKKGRKYFGILGGITGLVNGFFGSGGGIIAVPMLEKADIEAKKSHATSLALTLPLSIVSMIFYAIDGVFDFKDALPLVGSICLKKVSNKWLKRIFGVFLIIAGGRMILG